MTHATNFDEDSISDEDLRLLETKQEVLKKLRVKFGGYDANIRRLHPPRAAPVAARNALPIKQPTRWLLQHEYCDSSGAVRRCYMQVSVLGHSFLEARVCRFRPSPPPLFIGEMGGNGPSFSEIFSDGITPTTVRIGLNPPNSTPVFKFGQIGSSGTNRLPGGGKFTTLILRHPRKLCHRVPEAKNVLSLRLPLSSSISAKYFFYGMNYGVFRGQFIPSLPCDSVTRGTVTTWRKTAPISDGGKS